MSDRRAPARGALVAMSSSARQRTCMEKVVGSVGAKGGFVYRRVQITFVLVHDIGYPCALKLARLLHCDAEHLVYEAPPRPVRLL